MAIAAALLLPIAVAALVFVLLPARSGPAALPTTPRTAPVAPIAGDRTTVTAADVTSLNAARRLARRQLIAARVELAACRRRRAPLSAADRSDCARFALAHLGISGRMTAGLLSGLGGPLETGACRSAALGAANGLRMLAFEASAASRSLAGAGSLPRSRAASIESLLASAGAALRTHGWTGCRPALLLPETAPPRARA